MAQRHGGAISLFAASRDTPTGADQIVTGCDNRTKWRTGAHNRVSLIDGNFGQAAFRERTPERTTPCSPFSYSSRGHDWQKPWPVGSWSRHPTSRWADLYLL